LLTSPEREERRKSKPEREEDKNKQKNFSFTPEFAEKERL